MRFLARICRQPWTLCLLTLLSVFGSSSAKTSLDPVGIYGSIQQAQLCLSLTWRTARQQLVGPAVPNCLRFAFHDAGTYQVATDKGGANGSIMKELDFNTFTQNAGLTLCAQTMPVIISTVRTSGCPQLTAADAIQVTGAAAVAMAGGPTCNLLMGRPDATSADSLAGLPSNCGDANALIANFAANGFRDPVTSLVVLSGAHSIGRSQVTAQGQCSKGLGPMTANDRVFDNHYYTEVVNQTGRRGWFNSDINIARPNTPTAPLMANFAANNGAFLSSWCTHYQESSLLGVDPTKVAGFSINQGWDPTAALPNLSPPQPPRPAAQQPPRPPSGAGAPPTQNRPPQPPRTVQPPQQQQNQPPRPANQPPRPADQQRPPQQLQNQPPRPADQRPPQLQNQPPRPASQQQQPPRPANQPPQQLLQQPPRPASQPPQVQQSLPPRPANQPPQQAQQSSLPPRPANQPPQQQAQQLLPPRPALQPPQQQQQQQQQQQATPPRAAQQPPRPT